MCGSIIKSPKIRIMDTAQKMFSEKVLYIKTNKEHIISYVKRTCRVVCVKLPGALYPNSIGLLTPLSVRDEYQVGVLTAYGSLLKRVHVIRWVLLQFTTDCIIDRTS